MNLLKSVRAGLILCMLSCSSLAFASTNALSVRVEVVDGSVLIGTTSLRSVTIRTPYADVPLPLDQAVCLRFAGTNRTLTVRLRNGDLVSGQTDLRSIAVEALVGKVVVPVEAIRGIDVRLGRFSLPGGLLESLVLHYSFDGEDGENVIDHSPKENHGRAIGKPAFTSDGKVGGAVVLDGADDLIDAGDPVSLRLQSDFTMAVWVRADSLAAASGIMGKTSNPEQDGRAIEMYLNQEGSVCGYFWQDGNQFFSATGARGSIEPAKWYHVVMQHDSTLPQHQMRVYLDGVEYKLSFGYETVPSIPRIRQTSEPFRIGCLRQGSHQFKGALDEVMVFNRVLSAEEVRALYDSMR